MFYNTGAGSMWQCVDMATKDFRAAGINCVQYKNGARVNIASYAEMALRTANKRANLMGQAQTREKWGIHTVKVNARGTACPMCLQWLDKVYIDDVYGGGTASESIKTGYPLLSTAVEGGLYHPQCRDSCSTYYEGISKEPQEITKEQEAEIKRKYNLEQEQRYYERNYKKNMRMGNGCLDQQEAGKYFARASQYKKKLIDLCDNNSDVLRSDNARMSLRGVLSVDNVGRLSITPQAIKNANTGQIQPKKQEIKHTEAYNDIMNSIKINNYKIEHREVGMLKKSLSDDEIIKKLSGADRTDGSCASLAFAYTGNKNGLDVTDFRGGQSQKFFSSKMHNKKIMELDGVKYQTIKVKKEAYDTAKIIKELPVDKEYYLTVGKHAAIIKNTDKGAMYLELQSSIENGWKYFASNGRTTSETLIERFGARKTVNKQFGKVWEREITLAEVDSFKDNEEFRDILGYINTATDKQVKGEGGYAK